MSRAARLLVLAAAALFAGAASAPAAAPSCPRGATCHTVRVPLDRSAAVPGTVGLRAAVVSGRDTDEAPLVLLTGGPGQAGVVYTDQWRLLLGLTGVRRTFVTVDTRGTGRSGLLRCPTFERALARDPLAPAGACGRELGEARSFYRSADSAEDLEALRVKLGAERLALLAVSYGTRVALEYARRHPDRTDRVILDSPVEDAADPFVAETFAALPRVLRALCRASCPGGGPRPDEDLARLVRRVRERPLPIRGRAPLGEDDVLSVLLAGDLDSELMRAVPGAVRRALAGRPGELARLQRITEQDTAEPVSEFSPALYAATLCEEAPLAWDRAAATGPRRAQALAALDARPGAAFAPFSRRAALDAGLYPLCRDWPAPVRAEAPAAAAASTVPTLILAGELDLRTPLEGARRLAAVLGSATVAVASQVGHSVYGASQRGCATRAVAAFLRGRLLACAR